MPGELFSQAAREGLSVDLELAAARTCVDAFTQHQCEGKLYLNFSALALHRTTLELGDPLAFLCDSVLTADRVVIELTEQSEILSLPLFLEVVEAIRATGATLALDDYGTGNASMSLWLQLMPGVVKIDRLFVDGISTDPLKFAAVTAMIGFAKESGTELIAEGIENTTDLAVLRDLGIDRGQGYLFGRPEARPIVADEITRALHTARGRLF
ncbi:diguanylate cyclase/phosphodiesterase [Paraburkholderia hospita]|uniref:Diguanylate cyclase/phosphodiesterase n=2 Tax=Paraburkholderia hospita TaxID=169430 RepID=A0ABN0F3C0_9BURK|nr:diguanylate cyclase/phosphodiesterase [Paraburkholderia hospita]